MECPYCHGELEPGELFTSVRGETAIWYPKGKRILFPTRKRLEKVGAVKISQVSNALNHTWYCRNCKRLTIFNVK